MTYKSLRVHKRDKAMKNKRTSKCTKQLRVERLEERVVMATFGTPWPNPRSLSVSFPTDDAAVGAYRNSAREVFDQVTDRLQWQEAALRAFQTWSVHGNFNIGLVPDRGDDFGACGLNPRTILVLASLESGLSRNLACLLTRFHTNRLQAHGQAICCSTRRRITSWLIATRPLPIQVPPANEKGPAVELFSVLLHEAGNALGVADNSVAGAVMNGTYSGPNTFLKSTDISAIRRLYGARPRYLRADEQQHTLVGYAHTLPPRTLLGTRPVSVRGSLNTLGDTDFYRLQPFAGSRESICSVMGLGHQFAQG